MFTHTCDSDNRNGEAQEEAQCVDTTDFFLMQIMRPGSQTHSINFP